MTVSNGVLPVLAEALAKRGYETLTPVQDIVLEQDDADLLVSAQTGSGKTVAFGLAIAPTLLGGGDRLPKKSAPLALVIAPTRELALQVAGELQWLYAEAGAELITCVGGMDPRAERRALLSGGHIVVGTPGRLRDHIERGSFQTGSLRAVVLDEADEMLDLGFRDDLEYILDAAPQERRTLMFSATVSRPIAALAKRYQRDAVRLSTKAEESQHIDIEYRALTVAPNDRENAIINLLRFYEADNALVFCSTRATVNHMLGRFANRGFSVVALSGELSQKERSHALQAMRDGRAQVCIATDVAARGIDLPNLDLVIHAELPRNKEALLHRSGRTGRAGRKGVSALIVPYNARKRCERLLQSAGISATWASPPTADEVLERDHERILEDGSLLEPIGADEQALVEALLERHGAAQVAAAYVRRSLAGRSAPEELIGSLPEPKQKKAREHFDSGAWFAMSAGRDQRVEPRWLVPMLCRATHVTGQEIGRIRIYTHETYIEISSAAKEKFARIAAEGSKLEEGLSLRSLGDSPNPPPPPGGHAGPDQESDADTSSAGRPKRGKNSRGKPHGLRKEREAAKAAKAAKSGKAKRPGKSQGAGQTSGGGKAASGPAKGATSSKPGSKKKAGKRTDGGSARKGKSRPAGTLKKSRGDASPRRKK